MKKFKNEAEARRCAKAWALLILYHNHTSEGMPPEAGQYIFDWVLARLVAMRMPDGWHLQENYSQFENWYIENV